MRVAKWDVGYGNSASIRPRGSKFIFRHGNLRVRERRSANGPEMIQLHHESMAHAIEIRDRFERLALALLRALSISRMEQRNVPRVVPLPSNRRAHAGVHSPAEKHHGFSAMKHVAHLFPAYLAPVYLADQTPRIAGSQTNLCSCRPSRTGKPSARIHSTSLRGSSPCHFPAGSSNAGENKTCRTRSASRCLAVKSLANS